MNKVMLMGRLTREPEISYTPSGTAKLTGNLATSTKYKDKEYIEYHRIIAWAKTAEIIGQYFNKGDGIYIEGRLSHRSYEQGGETKYVTEVVVNSFEFPPGKSSRSKRYADQKDMPDLPPPGDDIPF